MGATSKRMPNDGPAWLDQVMGCLSPPFTFRNGGSAIVAGPKSVTQADEPQRPLTKPAVSKSKVKQGA